MPAAFRFSLTPLVVVALLTSCSPTLDWRQVRPEGAAITLLLPCKPERRTRPVSLAGASVPVEVLACSADGTMWGITSADLGDPTRVGAALDALRAARTTNLDGRETHARAVQMAKLRSEPLPLRLRVEGRKPDGQPVVEHSILFAQGSRVFHLAALGGTPSEGALDSFFGSVEPAR